MKCCTFAPRNTKAKNPMMVSATYNTEQMRAGVGRHRKLALERRYMTLEELKKLAYEDTEKFCVRYGID